jgi:hypothetical protein
MSAGPGTGLVLALRANTRWREGNPMPRRDAKRMRNKSLGQIQGHSPRRVLADFIATSLPTIRIALCFGNSFGRAMLARVSRRSLLTIQAGLQLLDSLIDRFNHLADLRDLFTGQFHHLPLFLVEVGLARLIHIRRRSCSNSPSRNRLSAQSEHWPSCTLRETKPS